MIAASETGSPNFNIDLLDGLASVLHSAFRIGSLSRMTSSIATEIIRLELSHMTDGVSASDVVAPSAMIAHMIRKSQSQIMSAGGVLDADSITKIHTF
jgi:hypothetical protein